METAVKMGNMPKESCPLLANETTQKARKRGIRITNLSDNLLVISKAMYAEEERPTAASIHLCTRVGYFRHESKPL